MILRLFNHRDWMRCLLRFAFLNESHLISHRSDIHHLTHSKAVLADSMVYNVSDSTLQGSGIFLLGGKRHLIQGHDYLGLLGNDHMVQADGAIGIGHDLTIAHDEAILFNASDQPLQSDRVGQLKIQADGGVHIRFSPELGISMTDTMGGWAHVSDATMKVAKRAVDPLDILRKVNQLPVQFWEYKAQKNITHIGPTAQDFYNLFNVGNSDKVIHAIDSDGVLLASIKGLYLYLEDLKLLIQTDQAKLTDQSDQMTQLIKKMDVLQDRFGQLDKDYAYNFRLLDQFEKDHQTQETMIDFVETSIRRHEWSRFSRLFFQWPVLLGLATAGVLLGLIGYAVMTRFKERLK